MLLVGYENVDIFGQSVHGSIALMLIETSKVERCAIRQATKTFGENSTQIENP